MSNASAIELLDHFTEVVEDFLAELRGKRAELVVVEQCRSELAALNAEISRKQQQLSILNNEVKGILAKLHLRSAA